MIDLEPATRALAGVVTGVRAEQLAAPTPCADTSVGDLLDHVDGLALAFTEAAAKALPDGGSQPPSADATRLDPDWHARIPQRLAHLARAWQDPDAWTGMTQAGGVDLPGELAGVVALNEVLVHAWDLAVATGQGISCDPTLAEAAYGFVSASVAENPQGTPGLFGPPVPVPAEAPMFDRLLGATGRDPAWRAPASVA